MSRMNVPWANPAQLGDTMPEFLKSPMTIAVGASIVAHGIFFLGLPVVTNSSDREDIRPVNVVQLTPQEQAQVATTTIQPQASNLLPSTANLLDPFSNALKPNTTLSPTTPGLQNGSVFSDPFPPSTWTPPATEFFPPYRLDPRPYPTNPEPTSSPSPKASTSPSPSPTPTTTPSPTVTPSPNATASPLPSSAPPTIAPTPSQSQPASNQTPIPVAPSNPYHVNEARKLPDGLVYSDENKQYIPTLGMSSQWYSAKVLNNPILQKQGDREVVASTLARQIDSLMLKSYRKPEEVKNYNPKEPILIGFVLAPNGQVLENSVGVARGSGYTELNAVAMGEVRDRLRRRPFKPTSTGKYEIYTVGVTFVQ